jgi:hypothetical protein
MKTSGGKKGEVHPRTVRGGPEGEVNTMTLPFYSQQKDTIPVIQEAWCAPGLVWIGVENLDPTRI